MKELFFSLINKDLFIVLLNKNVVVKTICEDNYRKHSENFVSNLEMIFKDSPFSINEIERVFFLTGPGSQAGERISHSFAVGCLISNPRVEIFSMSSLVFQSASLDWCLSVISIGEKNKRYHVTVYKNKEILVEKKDVNKERVEEIEKQFSFPPTIIDFERVDFLRNFLLCKDSFVLFKGELI